MESTISGHLNGAPTKGGGQFMSTLGGTVRRYLRGKFNVDTSKGGTFKS